jgi:hypothetical protein
LESSQGSWHALATRQPIGYYICIGKDPTSDDPYPVKIRGAVEIFSFVLHLFIFTKIRLFKGKVGPQTQTRNLVRRGLILTDIETQSLTNFAVNLFNVVFLCMTSVNVVITNKFEPSMLKQYPNNLYIYFAFLISPSLLSLSSVFVFYYSHKPLQKAVIVEFKLRYLQIKELVRITWK